MSAKNNGPYSGSELNDDSEQFKVETGPDGSNAREVDEEYRSEEPKQPTE